MLGGRFRKLFVLAVGLVVGTSLLSTPAIAIPGDVDNDGLNTFQENFLGTDPENWDSDGDLMPDGWEVDNGLDPTTNPDLPVDSDMDDLTNLQEYLVGIPVGWDNPVTSFLDNGVWLGGTDPGNWDTDGDGLPDGWEQSKLFSFIEPATNALCPTGAFCDPDFDGINNIDEYTRGIPSDWDDPSTAKLDNGVWRCGTDPSDPLNRFPVSVENCIANANTGGTGTAIPEPATLALFGFGLAGLGVMRRRRFDT